MDKKIGYLCVLLMFGFVCSAAALDFKPGKYEITTTMKMSGMPAGMPAGMGGARPAMTSTECLTKQDITPQKMVEESGECRLLDHKIKGNVVSYSMECNEEGQKVKSKGRMEYHGKTFSGVVDMDMGPHAGGMKMTTEIKGKRIGSCD